MNQKKVNAKSSRKTKIKKADTYITHKLQTSKVDFFLMQWPQRQ